MQPKLIEIAVALRTTRPKKRYSCAHDQWVEDMKAMAEVLKRNYKNFNLNIFYEIAYKE